MGWEYFCVVRFDLGPLQTVTLLLSFIKPFAGHNFLVLFFCQFQNFFEHAVQLPFTVLLYSTFPDNYAFLSLLPSQIKNTQSADTVGTLLLL